MKIQILKNFDADLERARLGDIDPKFLFRNDILNVEKIEDIGYNRANIVLDNDDVLLEIPIDTFQCVSKIEKT